MSGTSVYIAKWCDLTFFDILSWTDILLHASVVSKVISSIVPTMHHPSNVLNAYGTPCSLGMTSNGFKTFQQLPTMSKPIETHCPWLFSPAILTSNSHQQFLTRCFHLLIFCGIATSSSSTGKYSLVYVTGKSTHILSTDDLETFKPLEVSVSWLSSPFRVFILMVVFTLCAFNFLVRSVLMKVPWLKQFNMAWVLNSFFEFLRFIFTGTTQMLF